MWRMCTPCTHGTLVSNICARGEEGYGDNAGRGRKAEYTQQRYVNRLIRLKFSTVHVMASRVVYRFCL